METGIRHIYFAGGALAFTTLLYVFVLVYAGIDNEILKGLVFSSSGALFAMLRQTPNVNVDTNNTTIKS
jgi:hypothetical protein